MTDYNGNLVKGLDSDNDQAIQKLSAQAMEVLELILDSEDEDISELEAQQAAILEQIEELRKQGR